MWNFIIIGLILTALTVHRYLTSFWEQGTLPYPFGFIIFVILFMVTCFVNFVWMFGALAGIGVFLLCILQAVYSAGLWIFLLPWLIKMQNDQNIPKVNLSAYASFPFLVVAIAALTILNFFVSSYQSMWHSLGENVWTAILVFLGVLILGNVARVHIMSKIVKE